MSRVLVTGASGFVGRRLVPLLVAAGDEVHAVGRAVPPDDLGAHWHTADLLDDPVSTVTDVRPDVLVHLAWATAHGAFWTTPDNLRWAGASLRILQAFREAGGRRAVCAGTCAEYDWTTSADVLTEDAPIRPATLYGAAKAAVHLTAEAYARSTDFELAWGRVFFPYGPGEDEGRLVASVARALLAGRPAETTDGLQVRDFIYADDVARAFAALVPSELTGAVNVGSGIPVPVREVIAAVAEAAGGTELVRFGALPARPDDPPRIVADVRRLRDEVGVRPAVDLAEGTARCVASWKERA